MTSTTPAALSDDAWTAEQRKRFERWFTDSSYPLESRWFGRDADGDYEFAGTAHAWDGWLACALQAAQPIAAQPVEAVPYFPQVPRRVIAAITAYGDARADAAGPSFSAHALAVCIQDLRMWAALTAPVASSPAPVPADAEHPAAKRLRESFEAKYGALHGVMRKANAWRSKWADYQRPHNRDMETPVTEADVDEAERQLLLAVRAYAATQVAPAATNTKGDSNVS